MKDKEIELDDRIDEGLVDKDEKEEHLNEGELSQKQNLNDGE